MNSILQAVVAILSFTLLFVALIIGGTISTHKISVNDCEELNSKGYVTQLEGSNYRVGGCFVVMEDGSRVNSGLFNEAWYKKPLKKDLETTK